MIILSFPVREYKEPDWCLWERVLCLECKTMCLDHVTFLSPIFINLFYVCEDNSVSVPNDVFYMIHY